MFNALLLLASSAFAASYDIDASHTRVGFGITHMMVSTVRGEFGTVSGKVEYDPANVAATRITAEIAATSVDTRDAKRDEHLRSPDFFDAVKFPTLKFASKAVKNVTPTGFDVVGDLTLHGVTKEVTLHVDTFSKEYKDPWGNFKVGTHATGTLNRKDFGIVYNSALDGGGYILGDEVKIELDVEMGRK